MIAIINAELVMIDHLIPDAVIFIEDGKIAGYGEMRNTSIPKDCEIIDAEGLYVGPGLVDIHCHAGDGVRFEEEDPIRAAKAHIKTGTTSVLATLGARLQKNQYFDACERIRQAMKQPEGENIAGIYSEGPYLNPQYGSLSHLNPWREGVKSEDYETIISASADLVRVWALAPEREGILSFVQAAKKANPEVKFAVGHSEASPEQIEALIPYGLCIGVHHTNATGDLPKYRECRGVCVDETVNYNDNIYAELISDSFGVHVAPYMQRLIRKIKGDKKIILITDQTAHNIKNPEGYEHITDLNFTYTADGEVDISGSKLTLNQACRNYMKHTGASIVDAFRVASYNPAKVVGLTDRGEIREGLRADLIITDQKMNVRTVILNGKVVC